MNRALLTQALAFLQGTEGDPANQAFRAAIDGQADKAITAIEAALATPLPFPSAWMDREGTRAVPDGEREAWLHAGEIEKYRDYSIPLFEAPPAIPRLVLGDAWQSEMGPPALSCRVDYCETGGGGGLAPLVVPILQPGGSPPPQRVPEGMQLVPVTMTREMLLAWYQAPAGHQDSDDEVRAGYRSILAAAPGANSGTGER